MTDNAVVLRARQTPTTPGGRPPVQAQDAMIERAKFYASAKGFVPMAFYNNPGACLLAISWAHKHGLDDLTALQGLHVIDGKPSVSAALRVELATDKGFEFRVLTSTDEECSLDVYDTRGGGERKMNGEPVTVRITEIPEYRFKPTRSGAPSNWTLYPSDMLFAHACRVADRRYVRTAASLIDARQDYEDDPGLGRGADILPAVESGATEATVDAPQDAGDGLTPDTYGTGLGSDDGPVPDGLREPGDTDEPGTAAADGTDTAPSSDEDRKEALQHAMAVVGVKTPALLKETKAVCGVHHPTLTGLAEDEEHTIWMLNWLESQE